MTHSTLTTMLKTHVGRILTGGVLAAAMMACSAGPTRQLADARKAYDDAENSPAAERNPRELDRARIALDRAEEAHDADPGSTREVRLSERAEYRARMVTAHADPDLRARHDHVAAVDADTATDVREDRADVAAERARAREDAKTVAVTRDERPVAVKTSDKVQDKKAAAALQNLGQVANVKQEPRGVVITLSGSLLFPSGDRAISPIARQSLDQVAHALAQQPSTTTFQVEGYTDNSGSPQQNDQLAQQRAKAVADHLVQSGIDPSRIQVVSHGEHDPIANNDTAEGRASNRRVEIVVEQEG
jgi:outer membrane protein OmpA-like peptidoglycan-associated protein